LTAESQTPTISGGRDRPPPKLRAEKFERFTKHSFDAREFGSVETEEHPNLIQSAYLQAN
jgi:hypothetical protein